MLRIRRGKTRTLGVMSDRRERSLGRDLLYNGVIFLIGVVIAALNLFWWFWAESLLQHLLALGLFVVFGVALAWLARSRGVAGQVARELVDEPDAESRNDT
jgi:hypothetical protein